MWVSATPLFVLFCVVVVVVAAAAAAAAAVVCACFDVVVAWRGFLYDVYCFDA